MCSGRRTLKRKGYKEAEPWSKSWGRHLVKKERTSGSLSRISSTIPKKRHRCAEPVFEKGIKRSPKKREPNIKAQQNEGEGKRSVVPVGREDLGDRTDKSALKNIENWPLDIGGKERQALDV